MYRERKITFRASKGGNATIEALSRSLQAAANGLDSKKDVLFLILTSHGSPDGLAIKAGRLTETLTPSRLGDMLAKTGVRHKVVVISACYSGIFVPRLATPDMLVITAADANHPSFGCQDKAKWTYFGDAFFNVALRKAANLKDAFLDALTRPEARIAGAFRAVQSPHGRRRRRAAIACRNALDQGSLLPRENARSGV